MANEDSPDAGAAYFAMKRGLTDGLNPHPFYDAARAQMARKSRIAAESTGGPLIGNWSELGPANAGGRTLALLIDPHDRQVMYSAAVSGGVFKSVNAGLTWANTGDAMANLDVSSLAFDPDDTRVIYAGTGEGYYREDVRGTALVIRGDGIFVSRDAGSTWSQLPSTAGDDFDFVNDLAVSPHDHMRIYAATRTGVWRSPDGGDSWTNVLPTTVKGGCLDLALRGDTDGDFLFASCGTFEQATVYRNKNAESAAAWESVLTDPNMGRTSLAIAPSNPNIIYALAANNAAGPYDQGLLAVFRSDQSGDAGSWSARIRTDTATDYVSTLLLTNPLGALSSQCHAGTSEMSNLGWHANVIAVDPTNPDYLWAGGIDLFRSNDGGATWTPASAWWISPFATSYVHADLHAIVFPPGFGESNHAMYIATDGGVFETDNAAAVPTQQVSGTTIICRGAADLTFHTYNQGNASIQFYSGAATPDGSHYLGGAQDNGTFAGDANSWSSIFGGDGGYVAVDPSDPGMWYFEYQYANLARRLSDGTFRGAASGLSDDFVFVTPYTLNPNQPAQLWTGGRFLWRSNDRGQSWTRLASAGQLNGQLSAIAIARGSAGNIVAATTSGAIYRDVTTGTPAGAWPSTTPRSGFVSSLTFVDEHTVYATYALFGGGPHLWRSTDAGATWSPLGLDLPDLPLHAVAAYGNRLFLGTDLGIFVSSDNGASWTADPAFPAVITEAVFIGRDATGPALYAFTHGRGAWRASLGAPPKRRAVGH